MQSKPPLFLSSFQAQAGTDGLDSSFRSCAHLLDDLGQVLEPSAPVSLSVQWGINSASLRELILELNM